ncbi:hypothetical protein ANCCAN_14136 [Ancylostoma caninum]|uniref:Uncharacterized protein n=1 Tax=Ancylostoma caninum TaxID=29170 RepID=A0A368G662_ANCCA|nr:hypothetical protein ANCCAN_14136 [Ancylostoma caninum]
MDDLQEEALDVEVMDGYDGAVAVIGNLWSHTQVEMIFSDLYRFSRP